MDRSCGADARAGGVVNVSTASGVSALELITGIPAADFNGYTLYDGPSRFTRERILVILTGVVKPSANVKTGPLAQTWILTGDVDPVQAVRTGADRAICGDCVFRHHTAAPGAPRCYVNYGQGPASVWKAAARGRYPMIDPAAAGAIAREYGRAIRIGSYGDPGMVPVAVWRELLRGNGAGRNGWTGYTHQWRRAPWLKGLCMASVNNREELELARSLGWRTFRVVGSVQELAPREISCPASDESGHRTTCSKCMLCNGARPADGRASVAIVDHGPTSAVRVESRRRARQERAG